MKPVTVLLWLLTAGVGLSSIGLLVARSWYLRHRAVEELLRHGDLDFSGGSVAFSLDAQEPVRASVADLAVLLERVRCTYFDFQGHENLKDINGLEKVKSLRVLDLDGTGVSDVGPLAVLTNLQWLDLTGTGVSDVGPLAALKNLEWLDLSGTEVSDVGPLAALTNLLGLDIRGTSVPEEQVEALRKKLTKCSISW